MCCELRSIVASCEEPFVYEDIVGQWSKGGDWNVAMPIVGIDRAGLEYVNRKLRIHGLCAVKPLQEDD